MKCKRENFTCIFISTPLVSGLFILAALGLCCCMQPFFSCRVGATLWLCCTAFSLQRLLLLQSTGSRAHELQWLQPRGSVVAAPGL